MAPFVFLSYSHDSPEHKAWVLKLATDLRSGGVEASIDQWDLGPGQDMAHFMEQSVTKADRVLLVCSAAYVGKANAGTGGVGYEKMIVTKETIQSISSNKFVPIIRANPKKETPTFMGTRMYVDFSDDAAYAAKLEDLLREIHAAPRLAKPPLGTNPFAGGQPSASQPQVRGDALSDPWFARSRDVGLPKARAMNTGTMEVAFGVRAPKAAIDQRVLLEAAERSAIHTFGWPIAVVLNNDAARPKPLVDGIVAEVPRNGMSGQAQFDYWTLRRNGDFYLVQTLFEDDRSQPSTKMFFNTRIVRVAEALMYCRNLYAELGVPAGIEVDFRIRHTGLRGRALSTSNPNRNMWENRKAVEDDIESAVTFTHSPSDDDILRLTKELLDPLFSLFDFFKLSDQVYGEVVRNFIAGRTT